ncbi:MAG: phage minor capsid protein [Lachnospiraceae bacterium]
MKKKTSLEKKEYDITAAFQKIENELISSMIRNLKRHKVEEINEKKQWEMWQALQLKSLEKYRIENQKKFGNEFAKINQKIKELLHIFKTEGGMKQEIKILQAIRKGFKVKGKNKSKKTKKTYYKAEFFKVNDRKLDSLIKATINDMEKVEVAVLRRSNDIYRKVIFDAHVYANTGAGTYEKAVDMATKDFLARGIDCIEYKNGARHTISDYSRMAIRTASKRAYLQGEGEKRQEWGHSLVIVNKRGNPCPKCLPFCGKVFIDDVWSGGKKEDGDYPLLSTAVSAGLYHPNCKDSHTTYFPGVSTPPGGKYSKAEIEEVKEKYKKEQKQQYAKRQKEKYDRLAEFSLDRENKEKYKAKSSIWERFTRKYNN